MSVHAVKWEIRCDRCGVSVGDLYDSQDEAETAQRTWGSLCASCEGTDAGPTCPDCSHDLADHTTRVGSEIRVCWRCTCYRYSGELLDDERRAEWNAARSAT